jgi:hypothetical protein
MVNLYIYNRNSMAGYALRSNILWEILSVKYRPALNTLGKGLHGFEESLHSGQTKYWTVTWSLL